MHELKLKLYRKKQKMSQREIASILGITQAHYWKWEKGKSFPNAMQIIQLCKVLKCTPNDILGFKGVYKVVGAKLDGEI